MLRLESTLNGDRSMVPSPRGPTHTLSLRARVCHSNTRTHVRLLGPCFKTGRLRPFRQRHAARRRRMGPLHRQSARRPVHASAISRRFRTALPPPAHHIPRGYKTKRLPSPSILWHTEAALTRACLSAATALGGSRSPHTTRHVQCTAQCWPQSFPF